MSIQKLLIANRGEITIRIAQTAADMGIQTLAVFSGDDAASLHIQRCDGAVELPADGPRAYLDIDALIAIALENGCDAIHPGYGFLSENADFVERTTQAGLVFVGPSAATIALFGDKVQAKALAKKHNIPTIPGIDPAKGAPITPDALLTFWNTQPPNAAMLIKAVSGGGGRGMRMVHSGDEITAAFDTCQAEAQQAFGNPALYGERVVRNARHVEIQVLGDGTGAAVHFGERECSLQLRNQKMIEIAPSPSLSPDIRALLCDAALTLAKATKYSGLGTVEFLLEGTAQTPFFIEVNPRIQVEHTITEQLFNVDLVRLQLQIAGGKTLNGLNLTQASISAQPGYAMQCRVTMETLSKDGAATPANGTISRFEPPTGPGLRIDSFGYGGYPVNTGFDPLIAKLIVRSENDDYDHITQKSARALRAFTISGIATNLGFLQALLAQDAVRKNAVTTTYIAENLATLIAAQPEIASPVAQQSAPPPAENPTIPDGQHGLTSPIQATLFALHISVGDTIALGQEIATFEAMKMEHVLTADCAGTITSIPAILGKTLPIGGLVATLLPNGNTATIAQSAIAKDLDYIRPELAELRHRRSFGQDEKRPVAVAKRKKLGKNTARENLALMCDPDTFEEYGGLALAAQRRRRSTEDLIENTTGDGIITGFGDVNNDLFTKDKTRVALAIYDYLVLAGTQGQRNHHKQDRLFSLALKYQTPVVLFAEGGGGRPGDTDHNIITGLDVKTFATFAALSGKVPMVGVASGRCFAGNAALLGCCDVIIATEDANIGMAGPAMIEGGGLGSFRPEQIGPIDVQTENGVVDIRVKDEVEACAIAKKYLSYTQGELTKWDAPDQRHLRSLIPENRKQVYDIRAVLNGLADTDSVLELRPTYGIGIITAMLRIKGRAYGVMANNSAHLGGAIDGDGALKAARFMGQCDALGLPIISLCDTPGFLVGPAAEETGLVRKVCQMFLAAAKLRVPVFGVVLRKGYGLGSMAMVGGGFHENAFTIAWPTGEFGAMGLEGAVRLGFKKELEAISDPIEQKALFETYLGKMYATGKASSIAAGFEIDAVIDPIETRRWISNNARGFCPPQ